MPMHFPLSGHVDFEARAALSANFLERMIDPVTAQPYFNVHDRAPARAVHDWPDFVDLAARYLEGAFLVADMTGYPPASLDALRQGFVTTFEPETGLFHRPASAISTHCADLFDQTRALPALCTWIMARDGDTPRRLARDMLEGLLTASRLEGTARVFRPGLHGHRGATDVDPGYGVGPLIRPLVKLAELLEDDSALALAAALTHLLLDRSDSFTPEGAFRSHTHSRLGTVAGIHAVGKATGNRPWCELAYRAWQFIRGLGTSFGLIPEFAGGEQPPTTCETCALMDYADLMLLLARDGHPELWDDIDRLLHNHLIESQFVRADWARPGVPQPRTDSYIEDDVPDRMIGGFAGWAAATQMFGRTPRMGDDTWFTPTADRAIYFNQPRVAQNCCGPSGLKALHLVWSQAVERRGDTTFVHLAINRAVPGLRVEAPVPGSVRFLADRDTRVAFRIPEGADGMSLRVENALSQAVSADGYLRMVLAPSQEASVSFTPPRQTVTERLEHGPYPDEVVTSSYLGPSVLELTSEGGPADPQWRQVSSLWGKTPLYRGREEALRTPEPAPSCRAATIHW